MTVTYTPAHVARIAQLEKHLAAAQDALRKIDAYAVDASLDYPYAHALGACKGIAIGGLINSGGVVDVKESA